MSDDTLFSGVIGIDGLQVRPIKYPLDLDLLPGLCHVTAFI